jgi:uncharacterized phiE125 gp8 family phage protein
MNIKVVTPPVNLPVTVAELKSHCNIEIDDDDVQLEQKIKASVALLDPPNGRLGRALISQTLRYSVASFPSGTIILPYPPVQSITSIKYVDSLEVEHTVSTSIYQLKNDSDPAMVILKYNQEWPTDSLSENDPLPVKIDFVAGYGANPANVPEAIRLGIMIEVADFYMHRENLLMGQSLTQNEFTRRIFDNFIWRHIP